MVDCGTVTAMYNTMLCMLAMTELFPASASSSYIDKIAAKYTDKLAICIQVANTAETLHIKPSIAVSVALQETWFDDTLVSSAGALGAMQVIPYYACPKGRRDCALCDNKTNECDWIRGGILILKQWMKLYDNEKDYLCHYNSGNKCNKKSRRYARSIMKRRHRLVSQMKRVSFDFERF